MVYGSLKTIGGIQLASHGYTHPTIAVNVAQNKPEPPQTAVLKIQLHSSLCGWRG